MANVLGGMFLLGVGFLFLVIFISDMHRTYNSYNWPKVTATLLGVSWDAEEEEYVLVARYRYEALKSGWSTLTMTKNSVKEKNIDTFDKK